jgi:hypothetical protein
MSGSGFANQNQHRARRNEGQSSPRIRLLANQVIRHVQARQMPTDGRKSRTQGERMVRLLRTLIRFDATGTGECLYPSVASILKALLARESLYPEPMNWSRRTVLRYLARLRGSGIETANGGRRAAGGKWTRRRILHCSKILPLPVGESGTFERSNLALNKSKASASHNTKRNEPHSARTASRAFAPYKQNLSKAKPKPRQYRVSEFKRVGIALSVLNALTARYDEDTAWRGLFWAMRPTASDPSCERKVTSPVAYSLACMESLFSRFEHADAILERFWVEPEGQPVSFDEQRGEWRER